MSILLADIDATCAALGYNDGARYQADPDAIHGLKHLIWILRRDLDNHEYRRHLGRSKVLQTDLVYMLPDLVDDDEFADVLIRLLVILTSPTLLLYRDGPPKDNHGRKVFLELIDMLQSYKCAFVRDKVWSALFGKLQKSLDVDWALRSEEQNLLIERILVLIRNVLQVPANPDAECRADNDASLHDQVIWALHQSGMLDLVLFIISSPDEHQFHLHCLEILCLLYREQTAASLADASLQRSATEKQRDEDELLAARRREKQRYLIKPPQGRHSRFGGTYVIRNLKSVSDRDVICHQPLERVAALDFDREKSQQRRSFRHIKEEAQVTRRSAFSVRLCLREYCIEILGSAYNTLVRQVRRVLERNSGSATHDDSYLLWAIKFFMEFNRLNGLQLQLVSESLSVQCFHWVLTRMQHHMDMIVSDKKQARSWAKRLHVGLQTFRELLRSLLALQTLQDDSGRALFDMLLNNVCYVMEYRETILHLLMNYNEAHSTKAYLCDVVETANLFLKMMEKFCKDSVVVQDKKRSKKRSQTNSKSTRKTPEEIQEDLVNRWAEKADEISYLLTSELEIPEEDQPIPFDAASEKSIDDQKEDCMKRIHKLLQEEKFEQSIALVRAAREVWPENDIFGAMSAAPEDELLLLREIYLHNIASVEETSNENELDENESDDEENEEQEDNGMIEKTFKFDDFAKRLLNPKVVQACITVLTDWERIETKSLKAAVTILHRIAYGCSCPAMLYHAKLFRIFQQVFNTARSAHHEELHRLGIFVVRKFVETAPKNPKIYAELLFNKSVKEANELESGYCDVYESGAKGTWTEEQETELRSLFEENQRNPETDKDVIDWILENLIDKTRTRRGILKKLKEMGLTFKAPTKKTAASTAAAKNQWKAEEDDELQRLYDQYRTNDDCLNRIIEEFAESRNKQQIIKRMLQLHMIADKSEILPKKTKKRSSKTSKPTGDTTDGEDLEEPYFGSKGKSAQLSNKVKSKKANKPKKPVSVRTLLDVGTIRALLCQTDSEKHKSCIEWLVECLNEASEDTEEASEEDDGVPLVPLKHAEKEALEDPNIQKLLVALGIQPPIVGIGSYWRIPIYLNSADLVLRAKILSGENVDIGVDCLDETDNEHNDGVHEPEDVYAYHSENNSESEEDFFDGYLQRQHNIMFNKSDAEDDGHGLVIKSRMKSKAKPQEESKSKSKENEEISEDAKDGNSRKAEIFDQLKAKHTTKKSAVGNNTEEIDDLNFNSEDYRKRLLELEDSEDEGNVNTENSKATTIAKNRIRNVIDSDSDDSNGNDQVHDNQQILSTSPNASKKRRRQISYKTELEMENMESSSAFLADEEALFITHKRSQRNQQEWTETEEELPITSAKRRRIAVIDDDDD